MKKLWDILDGKKVILVISAILPEIQIHSRLKAYVTVVFGSQPEVLLVCFYSSFDISKLVSRFAITLDFFLALICVI